MSKSEIDKRALYGEFQRGQRWRDKLASKLAHKSLDIVDGDEMQVDNSRNGLGWKELMAIGSVLMGGWYMIGRTPTPLPSTPPAATAPAAAPAAAELQPIRGKIRFWVEDPKVKLDQQPDTPGGHP